MPDAPAPDFVTVAGINLRVVDGSARNLKRVRGGKVRRAFDLTLLSTERGPTKRELSLEVDFFTGDEIDALQAAISVDAGDGAGIAKEVTVTGVATGLTRGATFQALVWLGDETPWEYEEGGIFVEGWRAPLVIRQI